MQTMACIMPRVIQKNVPFFKFCNCKTNIHTSLLLRFKLLKSLSYSVPTWSLLQSPQLLILPSILQSSIIPLDSICSPSTFKWIYWSDISTTNAMLLTFSSSSLANSHLSTVTYVNLKIWWCLKSFCHSETSGNHFTLLQGSHLTNSPSF